MRKSSEEYKKERRLRKERMKQEFQGFRRRKEFERESMAASYSSEKFYKSNEWLKLRYDVLKARGAKCEACGATKETAVIQVDHILPRYVFPEKAFDVENLQVLCRDCNQGKGMSDRTDWRKTPHSVKRKLD